MNFIKKIAVLMTLALSLSLLVGGTAFSVGADDIGMEVAKSKYIIKPFKSGLETRCHYNEYRDVYFCRL